MTGMSSKDAQERGVPLPAPEVHHAIPPSKLREAAGELESVSGGLFRIDGRRITMGSPIQYTLVDLETGRETYPHRPYREMLAYLEGRIDQARTAGAS